ncbi:MAG: Transcriptional regulator, LacI family [Parcubacteria group bacterium GW2011_GWA2_43_17]|nr:MAG: Transcriptional regulator, LacI family [Parcubacteria group bacterium GW2011_GWA2_43_17]OHB45258.1 MAG: hypothetical protein A2Y13_03710 [Planctomycetes bacterium GWC2_45_44]HBR20561.1 LacI family transcriptional regulator [Phycisphaerales bacterium]
MSNIKDVAKLASVSISTVSHTLRGTKPVSKKLKNKINEAIAELSYEVNPVASSLKSKKTNNIGLIIPGITRIFFPQVIKGIQDQCAKNGYNLTFCDSNEQLEKEKYSVHLLNSNWVDGIILGSVNTEDDSEYWELLHKLGRRRKKIPIVSLERDLARVGIDSVMVNNIEGGCLATRHLIKCGCKNIVHITGPKYSCLANARQEGFRKELGKQKKMQVNEIIAEGDFSPLSGYSTIKELLNTGRIFDGVFSANDQMAVGALKAIKEHGHQIPEDIKIVGFDNTFIASIVSPSLTTINVPKYQMGVAAVDLIMQKIATPDMEPVNIELPINLIVRQSTDIRSDSSWELFGW